MQKKVTLDDLPPLRGHLGNLYPVVIDMTPKGKRRIFSTKKEADITIDIKKQQDKIMNLLNNKTEVMVKEGHPIFKFKQKINRNNIMKQLAPDLKKQVGLQRMTTYRNQIFDNINIDILKKVSTKGKQELLNQVMSNNLYSLHKSRQTEGWTKSNSPAWQKRQLNSYIAYLKDMTKTFAI